MEGKDKAFSESRKRKNNKTGIDWTKYDGRGSLRRRGFRGITIKIIDDETKKIIEKIKSKRRQEKWNSNQITSCKSTIEWKSIIRRIKFVRDFRWWCQYRRVRLLGNVRGKGERESSQIFFLHSQINGAEFGRTLWTKTEKETRKTIACYGCEKAKKAKKIVKNYKCWK